MLGFLKDAGDRVLGQDDSHHRQPAPEVGFDHGPNAGEPRRPVMGGDVRCGRAGLQERRGQIFPITEHERSK